MWLLCSCGLMLWVMVFFISVSMMFGGSCVFRLVGMLMLKFSCGFSCVCMMVR